MFLELVLRSSHKQNYGYSSGAGDHLTIEIAGSLVAVILMAIWLGIATGIGVGINNGLAEASIDLAQIAPNGAPGQEALLVGESQHVRAELPTSIGFARLRFLPFDEAPLER